MTGLRATPGRLRTWPQLLLEEAVLLRVADTAPFPTPLPFHSAPRPQVAAPDVVCPWEATLRAAWDKGRALGQGTWSGAKKMSVAN